MLAATGGALVLVILALILITTTRKAWPAFADQGLSFVTSSTWDVVKGSFGTLAFTFGTIVISLVKAGEWGWVRPRDVPFTVLGFAPTLPLVIAGTPRREIDRRVRAALDQVGLHLIGERFRQCTQEDGELCVLELEQSVTTLMRHARIGR